jgi:signal transduction histidine kinase
MQQSPPTADDAFATRLGELRAPLDSMIAYLDLLLEEDMGEAERLRFLEVIRSSAARARNLVAEHQPGGGGDAG